MAFRSGPPPSGPPRAAVFPPGPPREAFFPPAPPREVVLPPTAPPRFGVPPRDYQREALAAVEAAAAQDVRRQLLLLPTGTGKTIIFAMLIGSRPGRALILTHLDALVGQAVEKLRQVLGPDTRIGVVQAGRNEVDAPIVVASVQTLARPNRLAQLARDFTTLVVDEAHHAVAAVYQQVLDYFGCLPDPAYGLDPDRPLLLGVTATADRADRRGLAPTFERIVFERSLLTMIRAEYLCNLRAVVVQTDADLDAVARSHGDWQGGALGQALLDAKLPRYLVRAYRTHAAGRRALCFTPTVRVAEAVAEAFCAADLPSVALHAGTPRAERDAAVAALVRGELACLTNCGVFLEGWDCPPVDCVIVARPTSSRALYTQMIGRGTRTALGKDDCLIIDVVGASARHEIMTVADLVGLPAADVAAHGVTAAAQRADARDAAEARARGLRAMPGAMVSQAVDLFARQRLAWVQAGERFVLNSGGGYYLVEPEVPAGTWRVRAQRGTEVQTLYAGLSVGYAQGIAEDLVRQAGRAVLVDRDAAWRQRTEPPSARQRGKLWAIGYRGPTPATKRETTDLITRIEAEQLAAAVPATEAAP